MKKVIVMVVCAIFVSGVFAARFANAQAAAPSAGVKIGIVDFERAINEVNEGKSAKAQLKSEFDSKKKELETMENDLKNMKNDLDKQRMILSADALKTKSDAFQEKFRTYQEKTRNYSTEMAQKETTMTKSIVEKLQGLVAKIANSEGYNYVFEKSQGGIIVGPQNADLTDRVIKDYNAGKK